MTRTPLAMAALALALPAHAATDVRLEPMVAGVGQPVTLTVTTDKGTAPKGLDHITTAQVRQVGSSTQVSIVNGAMSTQATYTYRLVPLLEGELVIGPLEVGGDTTAPIALTVDNAAAAQASGPAPRVPAAPAQQLPQTGTAQGDRAFVRLWLGDDTPYVGQATPLTVSAYLREDVGGTIESAPQLTADDFVLDRLDEEPTRSEVDVDGTTYTKFTWTASLTPVRAGSYPLSVSLPATLKWVEQVQVARQPSMIDQMFANDPFFAGSAIHRMLDGFGGFSEPRVQQTHVNLQAHRGEITVSQPPLAERPADFSGAVGDFTLALVDPPSTGRVGEPLELRWTVSGTGNFDSMEMPGIPEGDGYSAYPPESTFEPSVRSRTKGTMRFTQLIVPRSGGTLQLPPVAMSWLDPDQGAYRDAAVELPAIEVTGSIAAIPSTAAVPPTATQANDATPPAARGEVRRARLLPWTARHGVAVLAPLAWLAILLAWLLGDRASGALSAGLDPLQRWLRQRSLRRQLLAGVAQENPEGFFRTGLELVRDMFGEAAPADRPGIRAFLDQADRALYAREIPDRSTLEELAEALIEDLDKKEAA